MFAANNYYQAVLDYTAGLELDTQNNDMRSNRAATYLALGCFNKSLEDAETVLSQDPCHVKAIYQKAESLCGLERFEEAISFLEAQVKKIKGADRDALVGLLEKANIYLNQQKNGDYDILKLYQNRGESQDVADYLGPIQIQEIPGKGRGFIAVTDIQPGQLVMASKAFAICFPNQPNRKLLEMSMSSMLEADQLEVVEKIAQKLSLDPKYFEDVYGLHAGPKFQPSWENHVDLERIESIFVFNSFAACPGKIEDKLKGQVESTTTNGCGLWILPSYFNHSCWDCNCICTVHGDLLMIRAFKKISTDEELTIPYISPLEPYSEREMYMEQHGFICNCSLCVLDRDDSTDGKSRKDFLTDIQLHYETKNFEELGQIFDKFGPCDYEQLRLYPSLVLPLLSLAREIVGSSSDMNLEGIRYLMRAKEAAKDSPLMEYSMRTTINIIESLLVLRRESEVKEWIPTLKQELLIYRGSLAMVVIDAKKTLKTLERFWTSNDEDESN